jgi:formate dehydrogenase (coenzyme F420) beta subunit
MNEATTRLREAARRLLESGEVKQVIGYERGTEPTRAMPCFITDPADCDRLIFDATCTQNLANYLRKLPEKAAVVLKGCDDRAVAVLIAENQLQRDTLYLIGVPCEGLIHPGKLAQAPGVEFNAITEVELAGDQVTVHMGEAEVTVPAADVLRDECLGCQCPTPPVSDEMLGEEIGPRDKAKFTELQERIEAMSAEERAAYFAENFSRCIRCYACVRTCPMCYCTTCFAVQTKPQYVPRTVGLDENRMFHMGRALHLAGRCVACGACDRACPVDIPLRALNSKLAVETEELFGSVAGFTPDTKPPLIEFLPGDTEEALDTHSH